MTTEKCGCKHDGSKWLRLCDAHAAEHNERHLRAQKEKDRAELVGRLSSAPDQTEQE